MGNSNDRDPLLIVVGATLPNNMVSGYHQSDVNLDGVVKYTGPNNDRDLILLNIGGTTPNVTLNEQLP